MTEAAASFSPLNFRHCISLSVHGKCGTRFSSNLYNLELYVEVEQFPRAVLFLVPWSHAVYRVAIIHEVAPQHMHIQGVLYLNLLHMKYVSLRHIRSATL